MHLNTVLEGKYRIEELLGEGSGGAVYRAWQMNLERPVAIKVLHAGARSASSAVERFRREALTVARVRHPNIVTVFDFGFEPGVGHFLVQELIEGGSLASELKRAGAAGWARAIALMRQICSAVQAAHAMGVIHRDLKPGNVLLDRAGDEPIPKVLDFGIARLLDDASQGAMRLTRDGALVGTPLYMPPEQFNGEQSDERSDVYSLGCMLYEMLTGQPPFMAGSVAALGYKHSMEIPPPPSSLAPGVPTSFDRVVLTALAKPRNARFQSAAELARALGAGAADPHAMTYPIDERTRTPSPETPDSGNEREITATGNLPKPLTSFVGRETDIANVRAALESSRLVTVTGPGGIGKTRLILQTASALGGAFPDRMWFVELAPVRDGNEVAQAFASALGIPDESTRAQSASVVNFLQNRRALLVADNCEHLREPVAEIVDAILRAAPGVRVLASSQATIGVPGETIYRLEPLGLPGSGPIVESEAVRLFAERARLGNPALDLTGRNAALAAEICTRLDGIPLAIELAAARTHVLALDDLLARLDDRFRLLTGAAAGERRQTLRATLDWSYGLLDDREQTLLRRLSVFAGGFSLDAVEDVCWGQGIDERDVLDLLERLVNRSLVVARPARGRVRYDLLETIRQYGRDRLIEAGEYVRLRALHRGWCLRLAETASSRINGPEQAEWIARLDMELDNLVSAMDWSARESGDGATTLRLCTALGRYWSVRVRWRQGQTILENALAAFPEAPPGLVAEALYWLGTFAHKQSRFSEGIEILERAAALKRQAGDARGEALVHQRLASVLREIGQTDRAEALFAANLRVFRDLGEGRLAAISINCLGAIAADRGDNAQALARFEESLPLVRESGDRAAECILLSNLGECAFRMGRHDVAEPYLIACLEIARAVGTGEMVPDATVILGRIAASRGDYERGATLCREAIDAILERGRRSQIPMALSNLARIEGDRGAYRRAALLAGAASSVRALLGTAYNNEAGSDWEEWLAWTRLTLGADEFDREFALGRSLSFEDAVRATQS